MKQRARLDVLSEIFGDLADVSVSLFSDGLTRLVEDTHYQVNQIRARRGLPPHDFSEPVLDTRFIGRKSVQIKTRKKAKRKAANA